MHRVKSRSERSEVEPKSGEDIVRNTRGAESQFDRHPSPLQSATNFKFDLAYLFTLSGTARVNKTEDE